MKLLEGGEAVKRAAVHFGQAVVLQVPGEKTKGAYLDFPVGTETPLIKHCYLPLYLAAHSHARTCVNGMSKLQESLRNGSGVCPKKPLLGCNTHLHIS